MAWEFTNDKAIFIQITERIKQDIVAGKYKPNEKLPTVRDLSIIAGVNPNTVQRAFTEIERMGLINTRRGDGRYVSEDISLIASQATKELNDKTQEFVALLRQMGFTDEQIIDSIHKHIR